MNVIAWTDVLARYNELSTLPNVGSSTVQDNLMNMAEAAIHSRLAEGYTVPFSTSNFTAKDLMVDMLYVQNMLTRQPEKAKTLLDTINDRIEALLKGEAVMVAAGGVVALESVGDTVWSSTSGFTPTFGVSDIEDAQVSPAALQAESDARDSDI